MTEIQQRITSALLLLQEADLAAVETKRQAARIIGEDFQEGFQVLLIPSFFTIGGIDYEAQVTPEQQALIQQAAATMSPENVLSFVTDNILSGHMYTAAAMVLDILIAALANKDLSTAYTMQNTGSMNVLSGPVQVGGCDFGTVCKDNYSATLCTSQGGNPVPSCQYVGPQLAAKRAKKAPKKKKKK